MREVRRVHEGCAAQVVDDVAEVLLPTFAAQGDAAALDEIEIPVQVNGKLRSRVVVPADSTEDYVKQAALDDEKLKLAIAGKQIVKVIVVPKKLVNIVVR